MTTKKLAIIGASYLQEPLIQKAKSMGIETHVFAWAADDVGEKSADFFYPISIIEKEEILEKCREIEIDGICSIASDLAAVTVNYVAHHMSLTGNSPECTEYSTNKHEMRNRFLENHDPSPKSYLVSDDSDLNDVILTFPVIVKPTDRSGSRGITKLYDARGISAAIAFAREQGFEGKALVEEFAEGTEYSIECISFEGQHHFLAMTRKFTTGSPHFIETGHLEPAPVDPSTLTRVQNIIFHALNSLEIKNGASHSEIKIDSSGNIRIIEIGGRMGGDFIGSALVELSTGIDFVKGVIDIALGNAPDLTPSAHSGASGVAFVFSENDLDKYERVKKEHPDYLVESDISYDELSAEVSDSSSRHGYYLLKADSIDDLIPFLPQDV